MCASQLRNSINVSFTIAALFFFWLRQIRGYVFRPSFWIWKFSFFCWYFLWQTFQLWVCPSIFFSHFIALNVFSRFFYFWILTYFFIIIFSNIFLNSVDLTHARGLFLCNVQQIISGYNFSMFAVDSSSSSSIYPTLYCVLTVVFAFQFWPLLTLPHAFYDNTDFIDKILQGLWHFCCGC